VGRVLERSMRWFGEVSSEFQLVRYRYDDECMHDVFSRFLGYSHIAPYKGMH
jgi:hypothetical protein